MYINIEPTEKQDQAYEKLFDDLTEFVLFGGAAGGGKSWLAVEWLIVMSYLYPGTRWFIGREELKRLRASTLITFFKCIKFHKIPQSEFKVNGQDNYIEFKKGSRIDLLDLQYQPRDPLYERFGSTEYTGGVIEEGGETHFGAFDVLKSRVGRCLNDEYNIIGKILITANPKKNWLYQIFYKPWKKGALPEGYAFVQAFARENQYIDKGYLKKLDAISDKSTKQRLKYGVWEYDDDDDALMKYDVILDLFTNDFVGIGFSYLTIDAARFGSDKAVIALWRGLRVEKLFVYAISKTTEIEAKAKELARTYKIPRSRIIVDEDGLGGGIVDHLRCIGFKNGAKANNKRYKNLKTECYYKLGEIVTSGLAYISDDKYQTEIIEELEIIKRDKMDSDGKLEIISKDKMRDLLGRSPDFADTLMMRMLPEVKPRRKVVRG